MKRDSLIPLLIITLFLPACANAFYKVIDLGTLGGYRSEAYSINNNGQIVGYAYNSSRKDRACLFDPTGSGANIDLGALADYTYGSRAFSINNIGQIVGWAWNFSDHYRACLFDPTGDGANIGLGTLPGYTWYSYAHSINDNGQIVGWAEKGNRYGHACLFDPTGDGANTNLGTLAGYLESRAYSINDRGQIVGYASSLMFVRERACLFDSTGQGNNIDLNTLIDPSSGWTLRYAYCINNNGWIVGYGINPDGYNHAFLLIPEPATILLLGLGAMLLRKRR